MKAGQPAAAVRLQFHLPPEDLRPFVTTIYQIVIETPAHAPIDDLLHPEWGNIRLLDGGVAEGSVGGGPLVQTPPAMLVGPTSRATRFRATSGTIWGVGLLPLGWSRLTGTAASDYADRVADLVADPALTTLAPFAQIRHRIPRDALAMRDLLIAASRAALGPPSGREGEISRIEAALVDPALHTVGDLARITGTTLRTLERLCLSAFGFSPQLLIRRQRFLRSLGQYMLDPSLRWIDTLDGHYHDQAHFVRDFKRFMGMSPSAYAQLPHPMLSAATHARKAAAGEPMQVLHRP